MKPTFQSEFFHLIRYHVHSTKTYCGNKLTAILFADILPGSGIPSKSSRWQSLKTQTCLVLYQILVGLCQQAFVGCVLNWTCTSFCITYLKRPYLLNIVWVPSSKNKKDYVFRYCATRQVTATRSHLWSNLLTMYKKVLYFCLNKL